VLEIGRYTVLELLFFSEFHAGTYQYILKAKAVPLHAMKALGGRGAIAPTHTHTRPRFSRGERTPGTHCTGGWVGLRAGLDIQAIGKILSPLPGIEPLSPGLQIGRAHV
jgi:hypothetical protein